MKFCEECGAQLEDDAIFCEECGCKVETTNEAIAEAVSESIEETAQQEIKSNEFVKEQIRGNSVIEQEPVITESSITSKKVPVGIIFGIISGSTVLLVAVIFAILFMTGTIKPGNSEETIADMSEEITASPTTEPKIKPTAEPTVKPTAEPTVKPTAKPTVKPTVKPTKEPADYEDEEDEELDYDDEEDDEEDDYYDDYYDDEDEEDEYILYDSDTEKLTSNDLRGLSAKELTYARNEIYARYGYVFESEELNDYFNSLSWYEPDYSFTGKLSKLEQKNANFIKDYQKKKGKEYKPK